MIKITCQHDATKKHGKDRNGNPRVRCAVCGKTWTAVDRPLGRKLTPIKDVAAALSLLLEGMRPLAIRQSEAPQQA